MANFYTDLEDLHKREFISFHPAAERVTLDGDFTPNELRRIADVIDEVWAENERD